MLLCELCFCFVSRYSCTLIMLCLACNVAVLVIPLQSPPMLIRLHVACEQVVMHDLLSGQAREIVRTVWDGKQPTALAFMYANSARLLGFIAGDNSNEIILGPVLAVGSAAGTVTLLNLGTLQVRGTSGANSAYVAIPV